MATSFFAVLAKIREWWLDLWFGLPCDRHPGHRLGEVDVEILTRCAMAPPMCLLCWEEHVKEFGE